MGILQTLKSFLGMESSGRSRRRTEPDVTVEHEPSASTERAVKTDADVEPETAETDEHTTDDMSTEAAATEEDSSEAEADESPPVEEITGIGPTYAERLEAAGIATVADLADSDISTIVEAAQATESRAEDWLEQARDR